MEKLDFPETLELLSSAIDATRKGKHVPDALNGKLMIWNGYNGGKQGIENIGRNPGLFKI